MTRPVADRFAEKYVKAESGCWQWTATVSERGYGKLYVAGRPARAHRVSWEIHCGPIPGGMLVLHSCDNRRCVNPDHLFLGTAEENSRDMIGKGRERGMVLNGERNPLAKLSDAQVAEIRRARASGEIARTIAERYGVTETTVYDVQKFRSRCDPTRRMEDRE